MGAFSTETLTAARQSNKTTTADAGTLVPTGPGGTQFAQSATTSTSWGALATDTLGPKGVEQLFRALVPVLLSAALRIRVRIPTILLSHAGAGAAQGRVNLRVLKNGVQVGNTQNGPAFSLVAADNTVTTTLLEAYIPLDSYSAGDTVDVGVQLEVTTASGAGGTTSTVALQHDPSTSGQEFYVEIDDSGPFRAN